MGSCEQSDEQGCVSTAAGGVEGLVGETVVQFIPDNEVKFCLHMGNKLGTLKDGDGNDVDDCPHLFGGGLNSECNVEGTGFECAHADGGEIVISDYLGDELEELIVEPSPNFDINSPSPVCGMESALPSSPRQGCCLDMDHCLHTLKAYSTDRFPIVASIERHCGQTSERPDLENASSVSRGKFNVTQSLSLKSSHSINSLGVNLGLSDRQVSGACSDYTSLYVPVSDGFAKRLKMPDALTQKIVGADVNIGLVVKSSNCEDNARIIVGNISESNYLESLDASLSLWRCSQSRETVKKPLTDTPTKKRRCLTGSVGAPCGGAEMDVPATVEDAIVEIDAPLQGVQPGNNDHDSDTIHWIKSEQEKVMMNDPPPKEMSIRRRGLGMQSMSTRRKVINESKRRTTVMKKAEEIAVLCDAKVSLIIFSKNGKMHTYHSPNTSVEDILEKYQNCTGNRLWEAKHHNLKDKIERVKKDNDERLTELRHLKAKDIDSLPKIDLMRLENALENGLASIRERQMEIYRMHRENVRMLEEENSQLADRIGVANMSGVESMTMLPRRMDENTKHLKLSHSN